MFLVLATAFLLLQPLGGAMYIVHKQPVHVDDSKLPIAHENVTFDSTDGLKLSGWYVPPKNGAVVIVLHGSGGDRSGGPRGRILMLARHGFGVLAYDARGSGDSEGRPENIGWTWHRDIEGAVRYLRGRGVTMIGGLGLSSGAEAMVETAGRDRRIKAVVAEGTQGRTVRDTVDLPNSFTKAQLLSYFPLMYTATQAMTRAPQPPSLKTQVAKIAPRPLFLISSGTSYERDANRVFYARPVSRRRSGRCRPLRTRAASPPTRRSTSGAWSRSSTGRSSPLARPVQLLLAARDGEPNIGPTRFDVRRVGAAAV